MVTSSVCIDDEVTFVICASSICHRIQDSMLLCMAHGKQPAVRHAVAVCLKMCKSKQHSIEQQQLTDSHLMWV